MADTSQSFQFYSFGSYDPSTGQFSAQGNSTNRGLGSSYLVDNSNSDNQVPTGTTVSFVYNSTNGSAADATYVGSYNSNGTQYPIVYVPNDVNGYYLLGQTTLNTTYQISQDTLVTCYTAGTLICASRGEVAVEDLIVGDLAVTVSGAHRPIRWIGSRTIDCAQHPRPADVMPVRINAGALGENRPARDLVVSPGHAICLDVLGEVLIPASALVNGTTITQDDVETVTYWHVELDSHDILIAEGQPAESYLDMGNRGFFAESGVVDLGALPDADAAARTHADFCRPFVNGGVVLDAVHAQIQARAERLGWRLDDAPWAGMHLMVDGVRVEADTDGLAARFVLPASAQDVWLVSDTSVPSEIGLGADPRQLGLCLQSVTIDDGVAEKRTVSLDDPLLCLGFHACEAGAQRWTAGHSRLPAALFDGCRGTVFLRIELTRPALPRWVAPEAVVVDETMRKAPRLSLVA